MKNEIIISQKKNIDNISNIYKNLIPITGEFAGYFKDKKEYVIYRDHIGCKKFFYVFKKKNFYFANNFLELLKYGKKFIKVAEPGYFLKLNNSGKILEKKKIPKLKINNNRIINLKIYLTRLKKKFGNKCIVCLSGGFDSTIIAYYANKIFSDVKLITAYSENSLNKKIIESDLNSSKKIAKYLKLKQIFVKINKEKILKSLKKILYSCQDWRDFNVHCAALNFLIAEHISKSSLKNRIILTGDFMNEFVADYTSEKLFNKIYYFVPKLPKKILQRFFINGLDTSSRETGVFSFFKLKIFQPFNGLLEHYLNYKEKDLKTRNFKYKTNKIFIPKRLFKLINTKKIRAQVGDKKSGGIIGVFDENNINQEKIKTIFCKYFNVNKKWQNSFFQLGRFNYK